MSPTEEEQSLEAARIAAAFDPERLRLARELRQKSQTEIADKVKQVFSAAAVSQWEGGHNRPSPEALILLAGVLDMPVEFFERKEVEVERSDAWFRSKRKTTVSARRQAAARVSLIHEFVSRIEDRIELPEPKLPHVAVPSPLSSDASHQQKRAYANAIEDAALQMRSAFGVPNGPIENVVHVLEAAGIVVVRLTGVDKDIDAFSVPFTHRPVVVLGDDKGDGWRSRLDACHEAVHLCSHETPSEGDKFLEAQANYLGGAFLMPRDQILPDLEAENLDLGRLVELKMRWGASIAAILRRAVDLEVVTQTRYQQWMKYSSVKKWRRPNGEPGAYKKSERPRLLTRATELALGGTTDELLRAFVNEAGLPLADVRSFVSMRQRVDLS